MDRNEHDARLLWAMAVRLRETGGNEQAAQELDKSAMTFAALAGKSHDEIWIKDGVTDDTYGVNLDVDLAKEAKLELVHVIGYEMTGEEGWEENALARFRLPNKREVTVSLHQEGYKRAVDNERWFTDQPRAFEGTQVHPDELWDLVHKWTNDGTSHGLPECLQAPEQAHELRYEEIDDGKWALRGPGPAKMFCTCCRSNVVVYKEQPPYGATLCPVCGDPALEEGHRE